ncbi:hypothetical protein [Methanoculleus sp.]|uniref:hypothetical protein n=1 Tax=Methanoculleus sp. TaxID=90427 RepID=UPI0025CDA9D7|nr:hypothetical protein [Methanoculleus sp.]MCK9319997.1 hypothetical protein [Methanoculleus sp.]
MSLIVNEIKEVVKKGAEDMQALHVTLQNIKKTLKSETAKLEEKEAVAKDYSYDYKDVTQISKPVEEALKEFGYANHEELRKNDKEYDKNYYNFLYYKEEVEVYDIPLTRGAVFYYNNNHDAGLEQ